LLQIEDCNTVPDFYGGSGKARCSVLEMLGKKAADRRGGKNVHAAEERFILRSVVGMWHELGNGAFQQFRIAVVVQHAQETVKISGLFFH
jgi:hypothetical protein